MNKWELNRAGLFNFWYYDDEILDFKDGKLLLRGTNGSGKSVTMQSLLPVLLDGRYTAKRLDPFGSHSRKMVDYLLGEKEVSKIEERTGYLFLEYKRKNTEQYITTGIRLQAKRGKDIHFTGFVITDGRRIREDFQLYETVRSTNGSEKRPLSRIELKNRIGDGGVVVTTQKEYKELVNRYVFGFDDIVAYDDLIKLLIELRSPKLSKDFKPTVIYDILEAALPALSEDDLISLSESLEQMDQTEQQMEQLEREVNAIQKIKTAYQEYEERLMLDQVEQWEKIVKERKKEETQLEHESREIKELSDLLIAHTHEQEELTIKYKVAQDSRMELSRHEVFRWQNDKLTKTTLRNRLIEKQTGRERDKEREEDKRRQLMKDKNEKSFLVQQLIEKQHDQIDEIDYEAQESAFSLHETYAKAYLRQEDGFSFGTWKGMARQHEERLGTLFEHLREVTELQSRYVEKTRQASEVEETVDQLRNDADKWSGVQHTERQRIVEHLYNWSDQVAFSVSADSTRQFIRVLEDVPHLTSYEKVKAPFWTQIQQENFELKTEHHQAVQVSESLFAEKQLLEEKRDRLVNEEEDPEPVRDLQRQAARAALQKKGHVHAPLYEVTSFRSQVPPETALRIERVLMASGLLDALILETDRPVEHDDVLYPQSIQTGETLFDYLEVDAEQIKLPRERIEQILKSIAIHTNTEVTLDFDQVTYRFGALHGHAHDHERVCYIGKEARQRHRAQLVHDLNTDILSFTKQLEEQEKTLKDLQMKLAQNDQWWNEFPKEDDLLEATHQLGETKRFLTGHEDILERLEKERTALNQSLRQKNAKIIEETNEMSIDRTMEAYQHAQKLIRDYIDAVETCTRRHTEIRQLEERIVERTEQIEEQEQVIQLVHEEWVDVTQERTKVEYEIQALEEQLKLLGAEEIEQKIKELVLEITQSEERMALLSKEIGTYTEREKNLIEQRKTRQQQLEFLRKLEQLWQENMKNEWKNVQSTDKGNLTSWKEHVKTFTLRERSRLEERLTKLFNETQSDLIEYRMRQSNPRRSLPEWEEAVIEVGNRSLLNEWQRAFSRILFQFELHGNQVLPDELFQEIFLEYTLQQDRLSALDRQLYEDILLDSVGKMLRAKIHNAKQWTKNMKELMENQDTSSGLKFSIKWIPKTADSEQEMDTKDLVSLLEQDAKLLKDEDFDRITSHFRSRIQFAKQMMIESGEGQTLLQVLQNVLDYRKWFSFELWYVRPNEPKRELKNDAFFKFSGGEKAMAMYVPLFTACYSRYQKAKQDAPYIISLDEAFAGVDENNISEMFEVVEALGFNYIMNSQVLWGDYATVSSLAIAELLRPKNANFVTVMRYEWDGISRVEQ
ncbi:TIGR02680 family protein [Exiguobacterium sp. KRL4]|uniref:TIGR02680 family protein n=1 Tax=Exiguobacterium sp. KRL4 TaxID=1914536 RepID=UPI0008F9605E|nr:TIGR02680 family protein [Exiguobacterium sp. KRL4]OIN67631.1 TIGR02680 family protein [Exiguobacterium sp. KRL4]